MLFRRAVLAGFLLHVCAAANKAAFDDSDGHLPRLFNDDTASEISLVRHYCFLSSFTTQYRRL